jgi:predicted RNA binding protein YcfA (HicA-like mRNA interferase family)
MPKLPRLTAREVARTLKRAGFTLVRQTGSDAFYRHPDGRLSTSRCTQETSKLTPTLAAILKAAGLSSAELRDLL